MVAVRTPNSPKRVDVCQASGRKLSRKKIVIRCVFQGISTSNRRVKSKNVIPM